MAGEAAAVIATNENQDTITAFNRIPYALISAEIEGSAVDILSEFTRIEKFYKIYRKGATFSVEGTNGDYTPATLRYKMSAQLINKQARFLFAETPDLVVEAKGDVGKVTDDAKKALTTLNDLIKTVLDTNKFEDLLIKAAKDCFIGKRVACLINFNEDDGVTITFIPSTHFLYGTRIGNQNVIEWFTCFIIITDSVRPSEKRILKKKYEVEDDGVYLHEAIYDGAGSFIEEILERQLTKLSMIPAVIFINDGLTGETQGESEIEILQEFETWYSKLSNADVDAERKSMNPIRYTTDMNQQSTKGLKSSAGSYWDLQTDQNLEKPHPGLGIIESTMSYSSPLKTTLDRIKTTGYEQIDMPNITLESMQGAITSGKSLKAIYWPLVVRCKEKMKMWGPQLRQMIKIIIEGAYVYPNTIERYVSESLLPVAYEIKVEQNHPLPEDEAEERQMDLAEVEAKTMSRSSYMKKWRALTDEEIEAELKRIALERELIDDSATGLGGVSSGGLPYPTL